MTDLIYTHISARLPGPENHFLINQYGVMFHEMRASDLVRIDMDGTMVGDGAAAAGSTPPGSPSTPPSTWPGTT